MNVETLQGCWAKQIKRMDFNGQNAKNTILNRFTGYRPKWSNKNGLFFSLELFRYRWFPEKCSLIYLQKDR